jgi:FAD binding domain-containing protein/aromatic ring hydroxylase-like protein
VTGIEIRDRRFERLEAGLAVAGTRGGVTRVMVYAAGQAVIGRTAPPRFQEVARLWEKVTGEDISGGNAIWIDCFDNTMGLADSYRRGRILLAGDAAHWHMPIGGQSLNVGLQDAVNLGWKLAGSVDGWAAPGLLDSYHAERHAVAERVLDYVAAQEMVLFDGADIEPLRAVLSELIALDEVRRHLARVVSNLDDRYGPRESAMAGRRIASAALRSESGEAVTADVLAGTKPVIVRLTGRADGARDKPGLFAGVPVQTIHAIPDGGSFQGITTMLLRPDGYVAWAGDDEEELSREIGQWFRARETE